jgi:hypothetical protein
MDRNQAKEFYPILKAFAEGKVIECRTIPSALSKSWQYMNEWTEMKELEYWNNIEYRIKPDSNPEPKFRPFKNVDECWLEMLKHQPFGWVIKRINKRLYNIQSVPMDRNVLYIRSSYVEFGKAFDDYVFADGTPFGVTIDEEKLWRLYV